ncbi:hypothetical protein TWF481_000562 [Arthrobotrys musiformis]|uniref:Uncharacterized protein n=1 Tax=Arthrobotrys musiformis TaxID=47236 RepID=A0AAV9WMY6_9PEZI
MVLERASRAISKISFGFLGNCEPSPGDYSPTPRSPSDSSRSVNFRHEPRSFRNGVDHNAQWQPEIQPVNASGVFCVEPNSQAEQMQSTLFSESPHKKGPTNKFTGSTRHANAPDMKRKNPKLVPEDKEISQIILRDRRKYICANCEGDPKVLESVKSNKTPNCFLCKSNAEMQKLSKLAKSHDNKVLELRKVLRDKKDTIEALQKSLKTKEEEASTLKAKFQTQTRELGSLEMKYEKLNSEFQKNESEISKLQQTESAMRRQGDVLMDSHAKNLILDVLRTKVKTITRLYIKNIRWAKILEAKDVNELKAMLGPAFSPAWHRDSWPLICNHPCMSTQGLVTALLSCTISKLYFSDPFFRCGEARKILYEIYEPALERFTEAAVVWRAKTNTLVNELSYDKVVDAASEIVIKRIVNSIINLTNIFDPLGDKRIGGLDKKVCDLVQSSIQLATDWHSREFHFIVISFDWLYFMKFDTYSDETDKYVTPFPATRKLEDGKLYGILAVINPGFIRYLKGDGETEYQEIVWEKAAVLLSENPI